MPIPTNNREELRKAKPYETNFRTYARLQAKSFGGLHEKLLKGLSAS